MGYNLVHGYNNTTTQLIVNHAMKIVSYDSTFVSGNGFYTTHFYKRILLNKKILKCERIKKQVEIIKDTKYLYYSGGWLINSLIIKAFNST